MEVMDEAAADGTSSARDWFFVPSNPQGKKRDPAWAEFFHSAVSIDNNCVALVRESLQNSLDAAQDGSDSVTVRFALAGPKSAVPADVAADYFRLLPDHVRASGFDGPSPDDDCQYLVVEDFGTTGLLGDPLSAEEPAEGQTNHFYYFFRHEGKSGKQQGQRGRWGIGRFVFPMSGRLSSIVALTIRDATIGDSPDPLLMGNSVLKAHTLDGQMYEPDGYWGESTDDSKPVQPYRDENLIRAFSEHFHLSRGTDPGLSVVVPFLEPGWNVGKLVSACVRDYFVPISRGRLKIIIDDLDASEAIEINAATLRDIVNGLAPESREPLLRDIELVAWAEQAPAIDVVSTYDGTAKPVWDSNLVLHEASLELARKKFSEEGRVVINVPISVHHEKEGAAHDSSIRVVLAESAGQRDPALFVRSGIIVSEAGGRSTITDARALVLIDDEPASRMLGDAEGPAHVNWSDQTKAFKQRYQHGRTWLSIVRSSPIQLLRRLRGLEGRQDDLIAAEYFPLSERGPRKSTEGKPSPKKKTPPRGAERMRLVVDADGPGRITARLNGKAVRSGAARVTLSCAYDSAGARAISAWEPEDFRLVEGPATQMGDVGVEAVGGTISVTENTLSAEITDPEGFRLALTGFDANRDVVIEAEVSN